MAVKVSLIWHRQYTVTLNKLEVQPQCKQTHFTAHTCLDLFMEILKISEDFEPNKLQSIKV